MLQVINKSILLLIFLVVIVCGIYPFAVWIVGQTIFSFQANGSILMDVNGKAVGSKLIAQAFTKDEYFQPRPSAASYDASASASSALAASNDALRDRVARALGSIVKYQNGQSVGPDIEKWFQQDKANILARWSKQHTDKFPSSATDIQGVLFEMWRQEHPDVALQNVPGDAVTTSASGLDPHITLQNAEFQLDRVAYKWASDLKRNPQDIKNEIEKLLQQNVTAPLAGLAGEKLINVLEVNLALRKQYGAPVA